MKMTAPPRKLIAKEVVDAIDAILDGTAGHRERSTLSRVRDIQEETFPEKASLIEAVDLLLIGSAPYDFVDRELISALRRRFYERMDTVNFQQIKTPKFTVEAVQSLSHTPDIRQALTDNAIADMKADMDSALNRMLWRADW